MQLSIARPRAPDQTDLISSLPVFVVGAILWWLSREHPAMMPAWAPWDFSWVEFLATAFGLIWFLRGLARIPAADRPGLWRRISFVLGVLAIYAVVQTRFTYFSQHMFFLNRLQHMVMHHTGPFLIALAWPWETIQRGMPEPVRRIAEGRTVRRILAVVQQPVVAIVLFAGLIYLWLIPAVHFRAMLDPRLYAVMNWSMILDGILFWSLVLDPRPKPPAYLSYALRLVVPVLVMFPQIALGSYLTFTGHDLYPYYDLCGRILPSVNALLDEHIGGIIVWIPSSMMSAIAFLLVLNFLRLDEDRRSAADTGADDDRGGIVINASAWTGR